MKITGAITKACARCGTSFSRVPGRSIRQWEGQRFCGLECQRKGKQVSPNFGLHRKGHKYAVPRKCDACSEVSEQVSFYKAWGKLLCEKHYYHYKEHGRALWGDEKPYTTPKQKRDRDCLAQKMWRDAVFKRDDFTCQMCGERGGKLNADHIKPWALFPELRRVLENGRTLCVPCHRKTPTYGRRMHRLIDALAEGRSIESFFETL